jgi:hypothetical protein
MNSVAPSKEKRGCNTALKTNDILRHATCPHSATITERMPEGHVHYAAECCTDCGRHLRWLLRPENVERQKLNGFRLAKLAVCDRLTSWERNFIRDVSQRKKLSPRQQAIVDDLAAAYLEEAA